MGAIAPPTNGSALGALNALPKMLEAPVAGVTGVGEAREPARGVEVGCVKTDPGVPKMEFAITFGCTAAPTGAEAELVAGVAKLAKGFAPGTIGFANPNPAEVVAGLVNGFADGFENEAAVLGAVSGFLPKNGMLPSLLPGDGGRRFRYAPEDTPVAGVVSSNPCSSMDSSFNPPLSSTKLSEGTISGSGSGTGAEKLVTEAAGVAPKKLVGAADPVKVAANGFRPGLYTLKVDVAAAVEAGVVIGAVFAVADVNDEKPSEALVVGAKVDFTAGAATGVGSVVTAFVSTTGAGVGTEITSTVSEEDALDCSSTATSTDIS